MREGRLARDELEERLEAAGDAVLERLRAAKCAKCS
jgi:hypothetical protein